MRCNLKIVFDKDKWKIVDVTNCMFLLCNKVHKNPEEENFDKLNKDIQVILKKLIQGMDFNKSFYEVFFDESLAFPSLPYELCEFWSVEDLDSYVKFFKARDDKELKYKAIRDIYYENTSEVQENINWRKEIEELISNRDKLLKFIDELNISGELKWKFYNFINNPKTYYEDFTQVLQGFLPRYKKVIDKYESKMDKFNNYFQDKINTEGIDFLKYLIDDALDLDSYEEIYVTTSFLNPENRVYNIDGDKIYLVIGIEYEEALRNIRGREELQFSLNVLNTLSDSMKFEILNYIKDNDVFGKQIAEKMGLSKATVSYHMNHLMALGIVRLCKKGKNVYYTLEKETLKTAMDSVKENFQL